MKFTVAAAVAAFAASAVAVHPERTFAVLRFNNKQLTKGRMDPNVSPGKPSKHVHNIMGGSGFSMTATGEDLLKSECSTAKVKGDNSNYWFPSLYFKDPNNGSYESVDVYYSNAYYFFEKTNDDIKAFPVGLRMISGDPDARTPPATSKSILDTNEGEIQPVKWTCPRQNYDSNPSWPANSDGKMAGMGDPVNKGEGVGFPSVHCDGTYSPLRADIHFPSCYNPKVGLDKTGENMVFPTLTEGGFHDCPPDHIHVPHLFLEVYWDTEAFKDRWTPGNGPQPFVLSNGDATGYSSHADFLGGWDEALLQHIIDTCDKGTEGMDKCPGIKGLNEGECTIPSQVDEQVDGVMEALPNGNVIQGWSYGVEAPAPKPEEPAPKPEEPKPKPEEPKPKPEEPKPKPEEPKPKPEEPKPKPEHPAPKPEHPVIENPVEQPVNKPVEQPAPSAPVCSPSVHVVYETVTVTAGEAQPTAPVYSDESYAKKARREHVHRHRRHH